MLRTASIIVAIAILAGAAVFEGMRTNRWGVHEDDRAVAARIAKIPAAFGSWSSTDFAMEKKVIDRAEATGWVSRAYRNSRTGSEVSALILCGPSGPIGSHTPDICYGGLGYEMPAREIRKSIALSDGRTCTYWSGRFEKPGEIGLEVCWAWGVDGDWVAAESPRSDFFGRTTLFKLYVTRRLTPDETGTKTMTSKIVDEFLNDFLPETKRALAAQ